MARARNIKPGFFTNDELVELPMATRLLFIGLWTLADREGRLEDRPRKIKMEVFPADDVDVDEALSTLVSSAFIQRYTVDEVRYIQVINFTKHQRPHSNESPSVIPPPPSKTQTSAPKNSRRINEKSNTANHGEQDGAPRSKALRPDTGYLDTDSPFSDSLIPPEPAKPEGVEPAVNDDDAPKPNGCNPFVLLETLCEVLGQDVSVLSPSEKAKQLAVAQRLIAAGMTDGDVRTMTRWLRTQRWITGGIDMFTLERSLAKWKLAGKPDATVTHMPNGRASPSLAEQELAMIEREEARQRGRTA